MSAKIIDLDAYRPHVILKTDECVHVMPVELLRNYVRGAVTPVPQDVARRLVEIYLSDVEGGRYG